MMVRIAMNRKKVVSINMMVFKLKIFKMIVMVGLYQIIRALMLKLPWSDKMSVYFRANFSNNS